MHGIFVCFVRCIPSVPFRLQALQFQCAEMLQKSAWTIYNSDLLKAIRINWNKKKMNYWTLADQYRCEFTCLHLFHLFAQPPFEFWSWVDLIMPHYSFFANVTDPLNKRIRIKNAGIGSVHDACIRNMLQHAFSF